MSTQNIYFGRSPFFQRNQFGTLKSASWLAWTRITFAICEFDRFGVEFRRFRQTVNWWNSQKHSVIYSRKLLKFLIWHFKILSRRIFWRFWRDSGSFTEINKLIFTRCKFFLYSTLLLFIKLYQLYIHFYDLRQHVIYENTIFICFYVAEIKIQPSLDTTGAVQRTAYEVVVNFENKLSTIKQPNPFFQIALDRLHFVKDVINLHASMMLVFLEAIPSIRLVIEPSGFGNLFTKNRLADRIFIPEL